MCTERITYKGACLCSKEAYKMSLQLQRNKLRI